jgi:hypothetical protein
MVCQWNLCFHNLSNSLSFLLHIKAMDDASERLSIVVYPRTMGGYRVMVACEIGGDDRWPAASVRLWHQCRPLSEPLLIVMSDRLCDLWPFASSDAPWLVSSAASTGLLHGSA